ncbi:MAG: phosphoadenylyl-sulfate reductase [Pseudomonadota bacterium]
MSPFQYASAAPADTLPESDDRALEARVEALNEFYAGSSPKEIIQGVVCQDFPGGIAAVSSFGAESAVLLYFIAQVAPDLPVLFLDTGKHFPETLAYRDLLIGHLGLRAVQSLSPSDLHLRIWDPDGELWRNDPDACCHVRKVAPLDQALEPFQAWISGRKRFHGGDRIEVEVFDVVDGRIQVNPLAGLSSREIQAIMKREGLPRHPLFAAGYQSIGCATCTKRCTTGEGHRDGRWSGQAKSECGIHKTRWVQRAPAQGDLAQS